MGFKQTWNSGTIDSMIERIEQLEAERDEAEKSAANIARQHGEIQEALVAERNRADALAAHVEYCHKIMRMVDEGPEFVSAKARCGIRIARMRKPETSLARLKAEWLEGIKQQSRRVRNYSAPDDVFEAVPLNIIGYELRQAEGHGND